MIKAVIEISDLLFKGFGQAMIENLARDFYQGPDKPKGVTRPRIYHGCCLMLDIIGMTVYTIIHSYIITLEMFTLHVAITSSEESVFSFLFYNNFTELKITVFKKVDVPALYQYACNDSIERFQLIIYLSNILFSTSQDRVVILKYIGIILGSELLIDYIKHFFITRLNKLSTNVYTEFKNQIYADVMIKHLRLSREETTLLRQQ